MDSNSSIKLIAEVINSVDCSGERYGHDNYMMALQNADSSSWSEKDKELSILVINILSLKIYPISRNAPYAPDIVLHTVESFSLDNVEDNESGLIGSLADCIDDQYIKATLYDVAWLTGKPRNITLADNALKCYVNLSKLDGWDFIRTDYLKRGMALSLRLTRQDIFEEIYENLYLKLKNKKLEALLIWQVADILMGFSYGIDDPKELIGAIEVEIEGASANKDYMLAIQLNSILEEYYRLRDGEKWSQLLIFSSSMHENMGDEGKEHFSNYNHYENAYSILKKIPHRYRDVYGVEDKLKEIRKKKRISGESSSDRMARIPYPDEVLKIIQELSESVKSGIDKKEVLLGAMVFLVNQELCKKDELDESVQDSLRKFPLSSMFGSVFTDASGRKEGRIPPVGINDNEIDLFPHAVRIFGYHVDALAKGWIWPGIQHLSYKFRIHKRFVIELCRNSRVVPEGRVYQFADGLWKGLEGDFVGSMSLLAPQVENIIRLALKEINEKTTTVDADGIEHEIGLSSLLDNKNILEVLDETYLFHFKSIFSESIGGNIRNKIAHGQVEDEDNFSPYFVYAWWFIFREVLLKSSFIIPQKDETQTENESDN